MSAGEWAPVSTKDTSANTALTLCFSPDYLASGIDFDTLRKSGWIADSLVERPIAGVTIVAPPLLTRAQLQAVHDPAFVRAVERGRPYELAGSAGLGWDAGLWTSVRASNGGIVHAARLALDTGANAGSLSAGLHHARRGTGSGFCTFNGLALAARAAIDAGASRLVILDLDAHCGGGTSSLVSEWPEVTHVDLSVSAVDHYHPVEGQTLELVRRAHDYLPAIERALEQAPAHGDLVLYNAGMDPHEDSAIGGLRGITTDMLARREQFVFGWARSRGIPVAFVLAGGYSGGSLSREGLVGLHRLTIEAGRRGE